MADDYMEAEEEWDRECLLDPAWEKQQKKVYKKHLEQNVVLELVHIETVKALICIGQSRSPHRSRSSHRSSY